MTNDRLDKRLYPATYKLLRGKKAKCFEQLATSDFFDFGANFRDAFEKNLSVTFTEDLFKHDRNFRGDLTGEDESNFLSRISELWLAAYFVREGFGPRRVKQKDRENTPDFQITVGESKLINVEVKRIIGYDNPRDISVHPENSTWFSAPTHLYQTDLVSQVSERLSDEKGITAKQLGWAGTRGVIALDIAASHDFQLLLATDSDAEAISWLRTDIGDEAKRRNADSILCFTSTLISPHIRPLRWFNLFE